MPRYRAWSACRLRPGGFGGATRACTATGGAELRGRGYSREQVDRAQWEDLAVGRVHPPGPDREGQDAGAGIARLDPDPQRRRRPDPRLQDGLAGRGERGRGALRTAARGDDGGRRRRPGAHRAERDLAKRAPGRSSQARAARSSYDVELSRETGNPTAAGSPTAGAAPAGLGLVQSGLGCSYLRQAPGLLRKDHAGRSRLG